MGNCYSAQDQETRQGFEEVFQELCNRVDRNFDQNISFAEFKDTFGEFIDSAEGTTKELFEKLNTDGEEGLSIAELKAFFKGETGAFSLEKANEACSEIARQQEDKFAALFEEFFESLECGDDDDEPDWVDFADIRTEEFKKQFLENLNLTAEELENLSKQGLKEVFVLANTLYNFEQLKQAIAQLSVNNKKNKKLRKRGTSFFGLFGGSKKKRKSKKKKVANEASTETSEQPSTTDAGAGKVAAEEKPKESPKDAAPVE